MQPPCAAVRQRRAALGRPKRQARDEKTLPAICRCQRRQIVVLGHFSAGNLRNNSHDRIASKRPAKEIAAKRRRMPPGDEFEFVARNRCDDRREKTQRRNDAVRSIRMRKEK
jgi:hypothetical protein